MGWPRPRRRLVGLDVPGVTCGPGEVAEATYPGAPGRLMVADVAIARTKTGPLYLAAVLDCYSRRCLGWRTGTRLGPELVRRAVQEATNAQIRVPFGPHSAGSEVVVALSRRCAQAGVAVPPASSPSAIDGAVAESFFQALQRDLSGSPAWSTRTAAAEAITSWIHGAYNRGRIAFRSSALVQPA